MKREADVKRELVMAIRNEGGYARRIEDRFSVGMPDIVMIPLDCPVVWVEMKIIESRTFYPSARQFVELKRLRVPPHSISFLMGWYDSIFYISPPVPNTSVYKAMKQMEGEPVAELIRRAIREDKEWPTITQ